MLAGALAAAFAELAPIGRQPSGGYRRDAWSDADLQCRDWFRSQAARRGLDARPDRNGNLWAWWPAPPAPGEGGGVATGSHLDSVPDGGAYDGPLGVVSGFLALDLFREAVPEPARPVGVVDWTDEEGARFGVACVGSRLATGVLAPDRARALTDPAGVSLAEAVASAGLDPGRLGADDELLGSLAAFVELHLEQGRGLVDSGRPVGLATAIWPHGRWRIDLDGEANHAGTTRVADRRDPMLPLAAAIEAARAAALAQGALATLGRVEVRPNATNAVPSSVHAWLDARAADEMTVRSVVDSVSWAVATAGVENEVVVSVVEESFTPAVAFDERLGARLDAALGGVPGLPTGAGHDAGILAARLPTAMLFVRNPTGVSHSPAEHADPADCAAGVRALAEVLQALAG